MQTPNLAPVKNSSINKHLVVEQMDSTRRRQCWHMKKKKKKNLARDTREHRTHNLKDVTLFSVTGVPIFMDRRSLNDGNQKT